ncbi:MAG: hypothetical protein ACK5Y2_02860 [Bdellovibrionales bacterium]
MRFVILILFTALLACQNQPCREIQKQNEALAGQKAERESAGSSASVGPAATGTGAAMLKVKVYKPDGSLQCGMGQKIPLEVMEKELKGIKVHSRSNRNDGLMRIQVCGAPTGNSNVYEIDRTDLEKALKKGFKEWTFE